MDNNLLTSEQKKLADVNGDGKITQEDADWIHENQVYNLGQLDESSDHLDSTGIFYQFYYVARKGAGVPFEVVDKSENFRKTFWVLRWGRIWTTAKCRSFSSTCWMWMVMEVSQ
ncbi:MAG: dockerin type I domain-containing protein [Ruminococcus callidus]